VEHGSKQHLFLLCVMHNEGKTNDIWDCKLNENEKVRFYLIRAMKKIVGTKTDGRTHYEESVS